MQILGFVKVLSLLCKATGKWGMFISGDFLADLTDKVRKVPAAPYLDIRDNDDDIQVIGDGQGFLLFDTESQMLNYYNLTVGDDGPTKLNNYKGTNSVYALTCDNKGNLQTETHRRIYGTDGSFIKDSRNTKLWVF